MSGRNHRNEDISDDDIEPAERLEGDSDEEGGLRLDEDIYIPPPPAQLHDANSVCGRLVITKIVNTNFKSYAGETVIGPFHECFSAIVGPNGSGKSNVIDSMLFVFGYRASKIRSKKISVLIHNSNEHPDITSCTVGVHFQKIIDKENGFEVVPKSEFVISRTAFKDSSSFYELSGRKVQFKEIAKLLRKEGVDLDHNRFLILQGEVEQISLMKPKALNDHDCGMLEFLEDIIGTTRYKVPLEKLVDKLETLSERVTERTNRLKLVERERDEMKEPMEEAVDYLKMENTITKLQHKFYHCRKTELTNDISKKAKTQTEFEEDLKKLTEKLQSIHKEKDLKIQEMKERNKKWDAIESKKVSATEAFDTIRKKDEALHAELVETNKRRKANMALLKAEREKLEDLKKVPEKSAKDIEECEHLIQRHTATLEREEATLKKVMASLKEKTEPLLKQRSVLETKLISHRKKVNEAKAKVNLAESELQIYTSVEETEKGKLKKLQETLQTTAETLKDRKEKLSIFETKIPSTQKNLEKTKQQLEQVRVQEDQINRRMRTLRLQLEEKKSAMNASRSRNRVIDALMQQKREGKIPGILGRLGDLGAIDAKFDVAMSTACGPLDNVVVDTVDTAQACIKFLKDNDIGRTTFIPLEKQQKFLNDCNQKIRTPENVLRLFDLIRVEDRNVLPAFYYAIRDTLVADDLNQASRIAYGAKRFRVVTLKGELIETSGTMSGGGRTVSRGRMGQSVVRAEPSSGDVQKLQEELNHLIEESTRLRLSVPNLEEMIYKLTTELQEMVFNKDKYDIDFKTLKEQAPLLKLQLKSQEKKTKDAISDPAKVKALTKTLNSAQADFKGVQEMSQSTEDDVTRINQEIENLSGGQVKEQQKKIQAALKSIDKAKSEICRLQVSIKTSERNTKKSEQRIETLENDVKSCEQRIKDVQKEKQQIETDAKVLLDKIEKYKEALKESDEASDEFKQQLHTLQEKETKLKSLRIDLDQKLSDLTKTRTELSDKLNDYCKKIKSLKLNKLPAQAQEELTDPTVEELARLDTRTVATNLAAAKEKLPESIPNMQIIRDFLEKDAVFIQRSRDVEEVTKMRNSMRAGYDLAKKRRTEEFFAGFSVITNKLKEMYQMITLGGAAELELVDSLDPFSEGIVFSVRPPKKSWKNISNLSGGEKTLSSLALVFALHHYKPTPLYFMDEIDAALDFKNVSIVGTYIKERTKNAQFIVISLRSEMFELSDSLVGIYKTFNSTKCVAVNIRVLSINHPGIIQERLSDISQRRRGYTQLSNRSVGLSQVFPASCPSRVGREVDTSLKNVSIPSPSRPASRQSLRRRGASTSSEAESSQSESEHSQSTKRKRRRL
ncbi:structural maintenance of chromosomes protein 4-like [Diachasmimorpha longicaudata]|uniref:structural maintenance of chromosomes protein 4-like n=1 Tax=Diachasmimorpha longicaudata TaxID=58733 RepID=UPI0030B87478